MLSRVLFLGPCIKNINIWIFFHVYTTCPCMELGGRVAHGIVPALLYLNIYSVVLNKDLSWDVERKETHTGDWSVCGNLLPHQICFQSTDFPETFLMIQWLRLCASNAGGLGSIPGQGPRSHMLQLRAHLLQWRQKIPCAATKTWCSQVNKYFLKCIGVLLILQTENQSAPAVWGMVLGAFMYYLIQSSLLPKPSRWVSLPYLTNKTEVSGDSVKYLTPRESKWHRIHSQHCLNSRPCLSSIIIYGPKWRCCWEGTEYFRQVHCFAVILKNSYFILEYGASLVAQTIKNLPVKAGNPGSIPGLRRSPGEGNGNPLQYSCPENPMDRGDWWATVHGVAKSRTWLSD